MNFSDEFYIKEGYICYREGMEKLYSDLDSVFISFLKDEKYKVYNIPAMIEGRVLKKCGYFESFPDQISAVGYIDDEKIPEIMSGKEINESCIKLHDRYLTPSACLHIYPMYEGKEITENEIITTKARVYRCEKSGFEDMTRLWDFSVREIVFIGSEEFVKEHLNTLKEKTLNFAKKISKDANLVVAHDHFYKGQRNDIKAKIQEKNELKFELKIPIGDREVAVASFNFHNGHFSIPFNFDNNRKIVSGCVGFGMERWVAACMENNISDINSL
ncbi:MAG: hypothetical protein UIM53_03530 [Acutalibacteraceae bacterium]|nr:hypothetical protein [Acutalibacteraceae bacterium]